MNSNIFHRRGLFDPERTVPTGAFMEVLEMNENYVRILAGFLENISRNADFEVFEITPSSCGDYDARFKLRNLSRTSRTLHFIVAEYDGDRLVNAELIDVALAAGDDVVDKRFGIPQASGNNEVRIMLWDFERRMPIMRAR